MRVLCRIMTLNMMLICVIFSTAYAKDRNCFPENLARPDAVSADEGYMTESATMEWLKKNMPEAVEELAYMEKHNPSVFYDTLDDLSMTVEYLEDVKLHSQDMYEQLLRAETLEIKSYKIAREINSATDPKTRHGAEAELKRMLTEIFQIRQHESELEIKQLAKEIESMKKRLQFRRGNKDKIIDRRMKTLVSTESQDLEW